MIELHSKMPCICGIRRCKPMDGLLEQQMDKSIMGLVLNMSMDMCKEWHNPSNQGNFPAALCTIMQSLLLFLDDEMGKCAFNSIPD